MPFWRGFEVSKHNRVQVLLVLDRVRVPELHRFFLVLIVELKGAYITDKTEMRVEQVGYAVNLILSRKDEPRSKSLVHETVLYWKSFPIALSS